MDGMAIVILGLSITSSWGNGHATTFRSLVKGLAGRGHRVLFLERDVPWYAANRDLASPPHCRTLLYDSLETLRKNHRQEIREADMVIVGSYVPQGVEVGAFVQETALGLSAFYDIDTPVTVAKLLRGDTEYLSPELIPGYGLYLSFTGGPTLRRLVEEFGSPMALPLYCSVDPELYFPFPESAPPWDLGYMGTYSPDRQPGLEELLLLPAGAWPGGRFIVAGTGYPYDIQWPRNVHRLDHIPPARHCAFYNGQRFTLNLTRSDMKAAGWSPSVRLFEAAACGTPVISDWWSGLEEFFIPGEELLVAASAGEVSEILTGMSDWERRSLGLAARERIRTAHTADRRAEELEQAYLEAMVRTESRAAAPA
jgi:spore maturation protein CgeB